MRALITLLPLALPAPSAFAVCVLTESGYRECYEDLGRQAVQRITAFDPRLQGVTLDPPPAFDIPTTSHPDLATLTALTVDHVRVDLGHPPLANAWNIPFITRLNWIRDGQAGQASVFGRIRLIRGADKMRARIKVDSFKGDRTFAPSEGKRRRLIRDVVFPLVIDQLTQSSTAPEVTWLN